jgi:hypothetical protein
MSSQLPGSHIRYSNTEPAMSRLPTSGVLNKIKLTPSQHPTATHILLGQLEWQELTRVLSATGVPMDENDAPLTVAGLGVLRLEVTSSFMVATIHNIT